MRVFRVLLASLLLLTLVGCGAEEPAPVMPDTIGKKLDVALSDIRRAGYSEEPEVLGGGIFGIIDKTAWVVCEQLPEAGTSISDTPRLTVDRSCGDESPTPTVTAPSSAATTPPPNALTAKQVERFLKESYGLKASASWASLCGKDPGLYPYPCAISDISLSSGVLRIRVQDTVSTAEAEKFAMDANNFLCESEESTQQFAAVTWVEISDASGGARGQQSAAANRMCEMNQ